MTTIPITLTDQWILAELAGMSDADKRQVIRDGIASLCNCRQYAAALRAQNRGLLLACEAALELLPDNERLREAIEKAKGAP